ncbi:MAG: glycoside hydrolase family 3 C-terminal domain-containing protein [Faecalibacterium prausnitzii]|nr:glycoside hydrolase family 3 C-terminal domain-containing protein [Faecalibacterium prausnitzii]
MKHTDIINSLDLEQKCALLSGSTVFTTRALPGKGVPAITLSDGPNGVRKQAGAADHLGLNPSVPATCFPTSATVANSWDPALGEAVGAAMGEEAAAQGVSVLLGPGLNIKRSPLCGRNFEYFSEDPYLAGKMAAAYVRGIQKNGIAACPKHFAVNSQELRRMASDSIVDERTLRELYLTGFEMVVKEAQPKTIMSSYNLINGTYANENAHLLQDILRRDWGFEGAVVTDWGGSNDHALGVKNGSTLEMPAPGGDAIRELMKAVQTGKITEADVDARLEELLELVFTTKAAVDAAPGKFDADAHHALARRVAAQSIVLLKNENRLLPLIKKEKVAVIGDFAQTPRYQGAGSSAVNSIKVDSFLDCLAQSGLNSIGYAKGFDRQGKPDEALKTEAVQLAENADVVLLFMGLDEIKESEGIDRADMKLVDNQLALLTAVAAVNPNVVVVLSAGSSLESQWVKDCKALVYGCLGGQAGAGALVDVLTGAQNPCGKLAETWACSHDDTPAKENFGGDGPTVEYREGLYVGYRYYDTAGVPTAFPFGYGLSYTTFAYSDLKADETGVTLTVTNTGSCAGAEVVQLYVAKPDAKIFRPAKELKGFAKVYLAAGESKTVTIPLDDKAFRYWNVATHRWEVEGGSYQLLAGASSADIRLTTAVTVEGTGAPDPYAGKNLEHYRTAQVQNVPDAEFEALLGRPIPENRVRIDRNMTLGEMGHGRSPLGWLVAAVLGALLRRSIKRGKPDLNILFQYNMPLRALAKMTNGAISMGMVDGIVMELQGFWIIGMVRVLLEAVKNAVLNSRMEERLKNS